MSVFEYNKNVMYDVFTILALAFLMSLITMVMLGDIAEDIELFWFMEFAFVFVIMSYGALYCRYLMETRWIDEEE